MSHNLWHIENCENPSPLASKHWHPGSRDRSHLKECRFSMSHNLWHIGNPASPGSKRCQPGKSWLGWKLLVEIASTGPSRMVYDFTPQATAMRAHPWARTLYPRCHIEFAIYDRSRGDCLFPHEWYAVIPVSDSSLDHIFGWWLTRPVNIRGS
jgi:hypothetical protein